MSGDVAAAIVGAIAGAGGTYFTLKSQVTQLRLELSATHRAELVRRQLDALEAVWSIFDAASRSGGAARMLQHTDGRYALAVNEARLFVRRLEETFNSKSGLYLSKKCRDALFSFRDLITKELVGSVAAGELIPLSEVQVDSFYQKRRFLRLCIRAEVGSTDLRITKEELKRYEAET